MMSLEQRIRIAIVSGGLGGACVAYALAHKPHLDVQVYEAAAKFSERGAAVGIYGPFLNALEVLVPSFRESVLDKAGAVRMNETTLLIGSGSQAGETICRLPSPEGGRVVHRAALLTALLALLPQTILHVNKRLTSISTFNDGVELYFADGTNERFHAVIGSDGIFGSVRKQFQAYDELRRPRGQKIIDSSRATGSILCCQGEAAGADIAGLGALLFGRWDFITNYDLREEIQLALVRVKEIQKAKEAA